MTQPEQTDPPLLVGVPDTGDLIDPTLPDPTGPEITDQDDESYVEPSSQAHPIAP
jgi:hypothetical protein